MAAEDKDLNRDPITDEPGSHPVGTGVGATGGAVAGAAAGAIGGPIGMAVGAARAPGGAQRASSCAFLIFGPWLDRAVSQTGECL